jgi:MFS family permease
MATHLQIGIRSRAEMRREDWLPNGVISGFVATFAMTIVLAVAYGIASAIGDQAGTTLERWLWALANNPVTEEMDLAGSSAMFAIALNLAMGLALALVYARLVEPALNGPGWRKGVLFSLIPWIFSVVAFLPIMGGGWLGMDIDAGPLPIIGNLILHLVYGAVLGSVYGIALEAGLEGRRGEREAAVGAERGGAIGVVTGTLAGLVIGYFVGPSLEIFESEIVTMLAGALVGAGFGLLIGIGENSPHAE